jgi:hypothetical protein
VKGFDYFHQSVQNKSGVVFFFYIKGVTAASKGCLNYILKQFGCVNGVNNVFETFSGLYKINYINIHPRPAKCG